MLTGPHACTPADSDLDALKRIGKDAKAPIVDRCHAWFARGKGLWALGKRDEASKSYRKAIELSETANPEHLQQSVPVCTDHRGPRWVPVAEMLAEDVETAKCNVGQLTSRPTAVANADQRKIVWPIQGSSREEMEAQRLVVERALIMRSTLCSQCGAKSDTSKLSACARCKAAFYCSPTCQREGWKVHKPQCREPGEHREGDVILLHGLQARPELNGQYFCVLGPDPQKEGRWRVRNPGLDKTLSVQESSLRIVLTH